jgi:hypothetical protein
VALKRTVLEALRIFSVYSYISTSVSSETMSTTSPNSSCLIMKAKVQQRCLNKTSTLVENEKRFKRACEQIVQLNYSLDALQQRKLRNVNGQGIDRIE